MFPINRFLRKSYIPQKRNWRAIIASTGTIIGGLWTAYSFVRRMSDSRIAQDPAATIGEEDGYDYNSWTKEDLYERAQEKGIDGRSTMSKNELIAALEKA